MLAYIPAPWILWVWEYDYSPVDSTGKLVTSRNVLPKVRCSRRNVDVFLPHANIVAAPSSVLYLRVPSTPTWRCHPRNGQFSMGTPTHFLDFPYVADWRYPYHPVV